MMKVEFEQMIGKEVSYDTFRTYEEMYLALPENVTKQQFVAMLNIDAIPESEDAIERKRQNEELKERVAEEISTIKAEIEKVQSEIENIKSWIANGDDDGYWKREIKWAKQRVSRLKANISVLKTIIA